MHPQYNVGFSDVLPAGMEYGARPPASANRRSPPPPADFPRCWSGAMTKTCSRGQISRSPSRHSGPPDDASIPTDHHPQRHQRSHTSPTQTNPRTVPEVQQRTAHLSATSILASTRTATRPTTDPRTVRHREVRTPPPRGGTAARSPQSASTEYTLTIRNNKVVPTPPASASPTTCPRRPGVPGLRERRFNSAPVWSRTSGCLTPRG